VFGHVLLRRADQLRQLLHARLALAEPVEQLDPRRFREDAEAPGDQLDQLVGKRVPDVQHCLHVVTHRRVGASSGHPQPR
jgi:hypothetical protein